MLPSVGVPGASLSELGGAIEKGWGDKNWRGPSQTNRFLDGVHVRDEVRRDDF